VEFYEWELNGFLVLRGVMDAAWLGLGRIVALPYRWSTLYQIY
jgi:hypothetical protein